MRCTRNLRVHAYIFKYTSINDYNSIWYGGEGHEGGGKVVRLVVVEIEDLGTWYVYK